MCAHLNRSASHSRSRGVDEHGAGARDLWLAARTLGDGFTISLNLAELNTPDNDMDPALRAHDGELLFASDRSGASLLYSATRDCQR